MSNPLSIVSLGFIGLDYLLAIVLFVGYGICDSSGKDGCHMKIFLAVCACLYGHGVNFDCRKFTGVFWGDCWNIWGSIDSC